MLYNIHYITGRVPGRNIRFRRIINYPRRGDNEVARKKCRKSPHVPLLRDGACCTDVLIAGASFNLRAYQTPHIANDNIDGSLVKDTL